MLLISSQLFMPSFQQLILVIQDLYFFFLLRNSPSMSINSRSMNQPYFQELIVGFCKVLFILLLQPLDCRVDLHLVFSLDNKDFVLKLGNQSTQVAFCVLMVLKLLFIASYQKLNLVVFLFESSIEVGYLFNESLLDQLSQFSDIGNAVFCFINQVTSRLPCSFLIFATCLPQSVSQTADQLL